LNFDFEYTMLHKREEIIPEQTTGIATNTESETLLPDEDAAKRFFEVVRQRLLHVNGWQKLAGEATASFQLTDAAGEPVDRTPQPGDHLKIDIPGPGSQSGDGYDWVQIEVVEEEHEPDSDCQLIRVRPATNPTNDKADVAHFFSEEATSSFVVKREGTKITAGVYGRNEKPNTAAETIVDKIRNTTIATGAISGFAKIQWKSLVNGLVRESEAGQ
jgi:hypothetical protein